MSHLCKDKELAARDAQTVSERKVERKAYYVCKKCDRVSHKEAHLCKAVKQGGA